MTNMTTQVKEWVRILEVNINTSAKEYMSRLDAYTKRIAIVRTWPRPMADVPLDETDGVIWIALIPILYFLFVAAIMGIIIAYTLYSHNGIGAGLERTTDSETSRNRNRLNSVFSDNHFGRSSIRSRATTVDIKNGVHVKNAESFSKCSITSTISNKSGNVFYKQEGRRGDIGSTPRRKPSQIFLDSLGKDRHRRALDLSLPSHEFSSTDSVRDIDNVSKESLRTSMESQKLLATGDVEIAPDDLYHSLSDNTAYCYDKHHEYRHAPKFSTRIELTHSGLENPSFECESQDCAERSGVLMRELGDCPNGSYHSVKTSHHHCNTYPINQAHHHGSPVLFGAYVSELASPVSDSESFSEDYPDDPFSGHDVIANNTIASTNKNNHKKSRSMVNVGEALPPLPPNHHHRFDATRTIHQSASRNEIFAAGESDTSIFDTSSAVNTSAETTLSLPSSIARFHASRVQSQTSPYASFPLVSTQNNSQSLDADWPPCRRLDTSQPSHAMDSFSSTFANRGSLYQSSEGMNLDPEEAEQTRSLLSRRSGLENHEAENWNLSQNEKEELPREFESAYKEPRAGTFLQNDDKAKTSQKSPETKKSENEPEVVKSERDPRLKRMMSLDLLKSGKASIEKRLQVFGYTKSKKGKTYVESGES